jgi:hypothetical protein
MIALNLFGLFAVTAMLVCHALERRKSLNPREVPAQAVVSVDSAMLVVMRTAEPHGLVEPA